MRNTHRRITRKKVILTAVGIAVAATAAFAIPQAMAKDSRALPTLDQMRTMTGTSWAVDPDTGQTLVTADSSVGTDQWSALLAHSGDKLKVQRAPGRFSLFAEGGDAIFSSGSRCSLGFNVTMSNGNPGILTAGHCTQAGQTWSLTQGGAAVATARSSTFPGNGDFALLSYNNTSTQAPSAVDVGGGRLVQITRAGDARVNQNVQRMGSTTGLRGGRVTALNAAVNYPEGRVTGLIQTTVCAEPGDSGGSLFSQDGTALGLTSGGSGNCQQGGVTFFQPVTEPLQAFGARIGQ